VILRSITVLTTWLSAAWRAYFSHWRVTVPASLGALVGLWFSSFAAGFGVEGDFSAPLGLPALCFRLLVVLFSAVGLGVVGRNWIEHHFPRR